MVRSKKTTWRQALLTFFAPILVIFFFRWALFEPYVIPSGSMIPTLLVHDHVLVNKWAYGFRLPFSETWLTFWRKPQPGEVVVFRYPRGRDTFYIKRIVAVEGDVIEVREGQLIRNGQPIERVPVEGVPRPGDEADNFQYYREKLGDREFVSRSFRWSQRGEAQAYTVPVGHFFVVGDNRDESNDSRFWGSVPYSYLIGRAGLIWLSCENTLPAAPFICDPKFVRWERLFSSIE